MKKSTKCFVEYDTKEQICLSDVNRRIRFSYYSMFLLLCLFFACSSENDLTNEETRELKLSVPLMDQEWLTTEKVDFEFEIVGGNGGYQANVSNDSGAKVTIEGNKVIVNLLSNLGVEISITDAKDQIATVFIQSTNESLSPPNIGVYLDEGHTETIDLNFGAGGPYTIKKMRGNASTAVVKGDKVEVTSLGLGDTFYIIRDKRGTLTNFHVSTSLEFEMDKSSTIFEFVGVNNLSAFVRLKWGTKWVILGATDNILESVDVSQVLISTGKWSDYYVLSIKTVNEGKGSDIITLKNEEGDLAVVKVHIL